MEQQRTVKVGGVTVMGRTESSKIIMLWLGGDAFTPAPGRQR